MDPALRWERRRGVAMSAGRRAGAALVGLLLGLGTLVVTARVVRDSIGSGAESAPASTSVGGEGVVAGATGPRLGAAIDVGHSPGAVAAAQDAVWVAAGGRLVHVDAHTGRVVARVRVGEGVSSSSCGVAVGAGAVWVVT